MKRIKFDLTKILFYISLFLIEFAIYTKNVTFVTNHSQMIINIAQAFLIFDSILKIIKLKLNYKSCLLYFLLLAIAIFSFLKTDDGLLFQLALLLFCSLDLKFDDILKKDIKIKFIIFIFIYICYLTKNVETLLFTRDGQIRYAFGFNQPNAFGFFVLSLFLEYVYVKKLKITKVIILFLITMYFISLASSRGSQVTCIIFMVLYIINWIKQKKFKIDSNTKILNLVSKCLFIVLTIMSFYVTIRYIKGDSFARKLDDILSERLYLQSIFYESYDINLFGNDINYFDTLDNAYIRAILNFGIVGWVLYVYLYDRMISIADKKKDNIISIIIFSLLAYGVMEWYILRPAINIFLFYFSTSLINEKPKRSDINEKGINIYNCTNIQHTKIFEGTNR